MANIIFYPNGTIELPSSHLRVYETAKELEKLEHNVTIVDPKLADDVKKVHLDVAPAGSIVYVQKFTQSFHRPHNFLPYKNKFTIVYDVDDWHEGNDAGMMEMAHTVVAGSHYIADYARQLNNDVHVACSITDTNVYKFVDRSKRSDGRPVQVVWTENFANAYLKDLELIVGPMKHMHEKYNIRFVLQGLRENRHIRRPDYQNKLINFIQMFPYAAIQKFMPINEYLTRGVQTLKDSDIGVIPFAADRVGKAGQNIRSLMSVGLAVVATPGNEHDYIITNGDTGLLAATEEEWEQALDTLIGDRGARLRMGRRASKHIEETYSRPEYIKRIVQILKI